MRIVAYPFSLFALGLAVFAFPPSPALGQTDTAIVMNILTECAKIADRTTRTACFDNNVGLAGPQASEAGGGQGPTSQTPRLTINILVQCAKIGEPLARVTCYDNNIRLAASARAGSQAVDQGLAQSTAGNAGNLGNAAAPPARAQQRAAVPGNALAVRVPAPRTEDAARSTVIVRSVSERRPGVYVLALENGALWEFAEDVPASYEPPVRGSSVALERGAFGNFTMRFDRQHPVRVQRLR